MFVAECLDLCLLSLSQRGKIESEVVEMRSDNLSFDRFWDFAIVAFNYSHPWETFAEVNN